MRGSLPDGWRFLPFREIAESVTERVDDPPSSGLDHYVGLEHLDSDTLSIRRWGSPSEVESTKLRFLPGDVIYARHRAYQRKLGVARWEGICSAHALVLRAVPGVCLPEFLPYFLQSDQFHQRALDISVGSLSPTINWKTLAKQEFALLALPQQREIAKAMKWIENHSNALAQIRTALQSLWDALIDDATWDSSCGQWSVPLIRVGGLLDEGPRNGMSPRASSAPDAVRSVTLSAVRNGRFTADEHTEKWCEPNSRTPDFRVGAGDVFIVRGNGNRSLVGRAGLAQVTPEPMCIYPDLLIRLRFDKSRIDPFLATALWNHRRVHEKLLGRAKSSNGSYKVNGRDISSHELPVPPPAESRVLLPRLRAIDELQTACEFHAITAGKLISALREKMLRPDGVHDV